MCVCVCVCVCVCYLLGSAHRSIRCGCVRERLCGCGRSSPIGGPAVSTALPLLPAQLGVKYRIPIPPPVLIYRLLTSGID